MTMLQWRDFSPNTKLPATWTDGIERILSNYVSPNFVIDQPSPTSLRVAAGTAVDARAIAIAGKPRWNEADVSATASGGAGTIILYAVTTAETFGSASGPPVQETDTTTRSFTLKANGTPSGSGGEALSRPLATVQWDGTKITGWQSLLTPQGAWMAGDLRCTARPAADPGWLSCDGAAVSRTTYASLFAAIGTAYGVGDGSTTFNVPDMRGRVPVGVDGAANRLTANDALGNSGGEEKHTLIRAELPSATLNPGNGYTEFLTRNAGVAGSGTGIIGTSASGIIWSWGDTEALGSDAPHNTMQPYQVVNWTIKT